MPVRDALRTPQLTELKGRQVEGYRGGGCYSLWGHNSRVSVVPVSPRDASAQTAFGETEILNTQEGHSRLDDEID
ncbi:hypothetical protein E2C01_050203 [Portunus trituberculatus]|uniref:Uncharacterized protein n=1 Tax=Portunus trituberculatus TaxID=210409 RepID=A0A5B7G7M1_PORTR|nr:hypothetical protein [Portunus trituberculatus]